jgi:Zn-finger protein
MANKYRAQSRAAQAERRKFRMCDRKVGYATPDEARQRGQDIYQCKHCHLWHRTGQLASLLALTRKLSPLSSKPTEPAGRRRSRA